MYNILIADDHPMVQNGISNLLHDHLPQASIKAAYDGNQVFNALQNQAFDLLILDINMPLMTFSDFEQILLLYPKQKILIFSHYSEEHFAMRYLKKGAFGYLNKSAKDEDILVVLKTILNQNKYLSSTMIDKVVNNIQGAAIKNPLEQLSGREYEIVLNITKGLSLTEIGKLMNITMSAASTYKNRAMQKLNVKSLVGLIEITSQYIK